MSGAATLSVRALTAGYDRTVLAGVDVEAPAGQCLAIVGRSGCGKSTLLHVLAGLLPPSAGEVLVGGEPVSAQDDAAPEHAAGHAAYMFQQDLLLPWKTALGNATFAARMAGRAARRPARGADGDLEARAASMLREFGLGEALDALPAALSGGMRQRVALARTVLLDRELILLDEPFGSLDAVTRGEMRRWLLDVMATHPATWVLVTHDVDEAVLLGDQVAVLRGRPARLCGLRSAALSRAERRRLASPGAGGDGGGSAALAVASARLHDLLAADHG